MSKSYYIIPIFVSHLGCPHQCVFCNQSKIAMKVEEVTSKDVEETIEEYLKTIKGKKATIEVSFFGGTFTAIDVKKQKELLTVAKKYKEMGKIQKIRLSTRPDAINSYILDYLKDYLVDIIELGVQSLNDEVLKLSGRGHSYDDVLKASSLIKKYKFTLGHQIMIGLPGDTLEKDIESTMESIKMKPDIARIYPALVVKDTPMEEMYNRGEYTPYTLEKAVEVSEAIYSMFTKNNIKVIRIGLQPTDNIAEGKDVIAGPFHPAFRELVEGSLISNKIQKQININDNVIIEINEKDISKLYANKKFYFKRLIENHKGNIRVIYNNKLSRGSVNIVKVLEESNLQF